MNKILKIVLIVLGVFVVAGGLFFAGGLVGSFWVQRTASGFASGRGNVPGQGMMNPGGGNMPGRNNGQDPQGGNQGMPGRQGNGMGPGMGGMPGNNDRNQNVTPLTVDEAKKAAQDYVTALKIDGLELGEVMIFDNNAYVAVKETATGNGAFELLVDPVTKTAYPEHGADMMWNLKYGGVIQAGMMNGRGYGRGMMNGGWSNQNAAPTATPNAAPGATATPVVTPANVSADMPIAQDQAIKAAQAYLDEAYPGATAATDAIKFYGYYTLDFSKDGKIIGMLSVNGYNGQIFPHNWHGTFIEESK